MCENSDNWGTTLKIMGKRPLGRCVSLPGLQKRQKEEGKVHPYARKALYKSSRVVSIEGGVSTRAKGRERDVLVWNRYVQKWSVSRVEKRRELRIRENAATLRCLLQYTVFELVKT